MKELDEMRSELSRVKTKLAHLDAETERTSGHATNPAADVGGIRSRSKKKKRQMRERWSRQAKEYTELSAERRRLETAIKAAEARTQKRAATETIERVLRDKLRPGDVVHTMYQRPATVVRCNAKSVTVELPGGFQDRVAWQAIRPAEWERMYAEWKVEAERDAA